MPARYLLIAGLMASTFGLFSGPILSYILQKMLLEPKAYHSLNPEYRFRGVIREVSESTLILETPSPFQKSDPRVFRIRVNSNTLVVENLPILGTRGVVSNSDGKLLDKKTLASGSVATVRADLENGSFLARVVYVIPAFQP